ncbi:MAG: magnesium chelatase [Firmicutes bacterium HGW-Firmicutes-12]|nr:MAG: magnesium chelatase [Firmicutes bacterium HGW-Firmicutes-12]
MLARVFSCTTVGMEPCLVEVEVDVGGGLPCLEIVGLPNITVKESKERVRTAIKNSGFEFPPRRIIINLAPADVRKEGPGFDLAIAAGILAATGQLKAKDLESYVLVGELSLDGRLRPVPGILPMSLFLAEKTDKSFIISRENNGEASLTKINTYGLSSLAEVKEILEKPGISLPIEQTSLGGILEEVPVEVTDMAEVKGQEMAKRALEVAAAGGHNIIFVGSPGSGKSLLARCLPSILPPLTSQEALEVSKIYSVAGLLSREKPIVTTRPFRAPHHSSSLASIIGGGQVPKPGELTLATHGILFLDELPEYRRDVLESMRQPMEDKVVTLSRVAAAITYPAKFQLVGSANPCYCGYFGDPVKECTCTPYQVNKYRNKISGPLLDRIDIQIEVPRVSYQELDSSEQEEPSKIVRNRVIQARQRQLERFGKLPITCNAQMGAKEVRKYCAIKGSARELLAQAFKALGLSARAHDRILKVARTVADLAGSNEIQSTHVAEAIQYRSFDRV